MNPMTHSSWLHGHPCPSREVLARRYPSNAVDCRTAIILLRLSQYNNLDNNTVRPTGKQPTVETGLSKVSLSSSRMGYYCSMYTGTTLQVHPPCDCSAELTLSPDSDRLCRQKALVRILCKIQGDQSSAALGLLPCSLQLTVPLRISY